MQGRSMADVAREAGVDRRTLYQTFLRPYPKMEIVLANCVDLAPQTLFPERYDSLGLPNRKLGRKPNSTVKTAKNNSASINHLHAKHVKRIRHGE